MKKFTSMIGSLLLLSTITACSFLDPNSKGIGEVFAMSYDNYEITLDSQNRTTMDYQIDVTMTSPGIDSSVVVAKFNNSSIYFQQIVHHEVEGENSFHVKTQYTGYIDYTDDRLYYEKIDSQIPTAGGTAEVTFNDKSFLSLSSEDVMVIFDTAIQAKSSIENDVMPQLDSAAVDLLVGKSSLEDNEYHFDISVLSLLDLSFLDSLVGVTPSDANFSLTYNVETFLTEIEGTYDYGDETYEISLIMSRPGEVEDSETVLSSTQKASYLN